MRKLLVAAFLALCVAVPGAMAEDAPEPPEAEPAPAEAPKQADPVKAVETMKFSQQQTIIQPTEIRIGPGIACRMDGTVLDCNLAQPAPAPAEEVK